MFVLIHLSGLVSYKYPYLGPVAAGELDEGEGKKDLFIRVPFKYLTKKPVFARKNNRRKQRIYRR